MGSNSSHKKRASSQYDEARRKETLEKLNAAFRRLKRRTEHENKPVSLSALSRESGVTRPTIRKYPTIMKRLDKEKGINVELKSSVLKIKNVHTLEQAIPALVTLNTAYNDAAEKYNRELKKNSELVLKLARLQMKNKELLHVVETLQQSAE